MILILRLIISIIVAVIISRFFFSDASIYKIFGFALILMGFAYLFEYTKKRDAGGTNGK